MYFHNYQKHNCIFIEELFYFVKTGDMDNHENEENEMYFNWTAH